MSKYWKTYPLGSSEAMKQEPPINPPSTSVKGVYGHEFKCQHGHEDCSDKPNGDCWLDWLREEQYQAAMQDAINEQMYNDNQ
tara:strand:+ start:249 stop:494 length:246 start_codon:yes stop_codon:yes gene_type:complete